jgi:hypothetical protein
VLGPPLCLIRAFAHAFRSSVMLDEPLPPVAQITDHTWSVTGEYRAAYS